MSPIEQLHQSVDQTISASFARNGTTPPCCAGCFHCCRESVMSSYSEVQLIATKLSKEQTQRVTQRTKVWLSTFLKSGLQKQAEPYMQDYRALKLWCPLLEDGRCMVYASRPFSCRAHFALESAAGCEHDELRPKQKFAHFQGLEERTAGRWLQSLPDGSVEIMDHLGVLLAKRFLGRDERTAGRIIYKIKGEMLEIQCSQERQDKLDERRKQLRDLDSVRSPEGSPK